MKLKVLKMYDDVELPLYATKGSACFDIFAYECVTSTNRTATYSTGLKFDIPEGYKIVVHSRSGHGFNKNIRLANCTGIIDCDYTGELMVKLTYDGDERMDDLSGQRICQASLEEVIQAEFEVVTEIKTTERGEGGFGSTDKKVTNA